MESSSRVALSGSRYPFAGGFSCPAGATSVPYLWLAGDAVLVADLLTRGVAFPAMAGSFAKMSDARTYFQSAVKMLNS
jgi:hypothetical protein